MFISPHMHVYLLCESTYRHLFNFSNLLRFMPFCISLPVKSVEYISAMIVKNSLTEVESTKIFQFAC